MKPGKRQLRQAVVNAMQNSQNSIDDLVCPECKKELYLNIEKNGLICEKCKLVYPIRNNIPIMLIEQAKAFE